MVGGQRVGSPVGVYVYVSACAQAHVCGAAPLGLRGLAYRQQSLICSLKRQSQAQLKQFGNSEAHFLVQDLTSDPTSLISQFVRP